jgi:hypothetical protein
VLFHRQHGNRRVGNHMIVTAKEHDSELAEISARLPFAWSPEWHSSWASRQAAPAPHFRGRIKSKPGHKEWVRHVVAPKGRGERTQPDVIAYLRRFVVGAEDYLDDWLTRERSG